MTRHTITPVPEQVRPAVWEAEHRPPPIGRGWLYLLVAAMVLMWTANFIVGKVAVREFSVLALGGLRIQLASAILLAVLVARRGLAGLEPLRREWKLMALLALSGVVLTQCLFVAGLKYTSVAHSSLIISLGPVFVLVLARLHGLEELSALKVLGLGVSLAGMAVLVGERHPGQAPSLLGDLLAATGCLAFSYYVILSKEVTPRFDSLALNTYTFLVGGLMLVPVSLAAVAAGGLSQVTWKGWLAMVYMSVCASVLAYLIFYYALRFISATRLTALSYLQPPLATFLGFVLLKEQVTLRLLVGAAVIFTGVYLAERG